mmetsp:Transcript_1480/g.3500  ORF Transcript_1480/g.3500 Transcript_1480/m.3500 type:complete len:92 (-) Transcript_1480:46-321(-)
MTCLQLQMVMKLEFNFSPVVTNPIRFEGSDACIGVAHALDSAEEGDECTGACRVPTASSGRLRRCSSMEFKGHGEHGLMPGLGRRVVLCFA